MQKEFTEKQKKVLDLLNEISENGVVKITYDRLAMDLAERKGMTGLGGNVMRGSDAGRFVLFLEKEGFIRVEQGKNTRARARDRIIHIIEKI